MGVRDRVRPAVVSLLEEKGYRGLTFEGVTASSGVAKTTLYRRWPTRAEMVFDLVVHDRELPPLDTDLSLEGVCDALARRVVDFMAGAPGGQVMSALMVDMTADPRLGERLRSGFVSGGAQELEHVLSRAGLIPAPGLSVSDLQMTLLGAAQAWLTVLDLPGDAVEARLRTLAATLLREAV